MSASFCLNCLSPKSGLAVCPECGWYPGQSVSQADYLLPGTVLQSPYQVARVLGQGGFGITYLGWDANLQIKVAIKEYLPRDFARREPRSGQVRSLAGDAEVDFARGLQQFLDEARALARFQQHPGIVSVLSFFRALGTGYMVMEYVEGETLKHYLKRVGGRLNWQQTLDVFLQIMDALRAVHRAGMLHRDIAPDNIYLCRDGRIKLLDFGAARDTLLTDSRALVVLKPGFAPEEQYRGEDYQGPWSDVYSVAASMYFCLTGHAPPDASERLLQDRLLTPAQQGAWLPPASEAALLAALAVRASQRPQSIEMFQQQLLKGNEPGPAGRNHRPLNAVRAESSEGQDTPGFDPLGPNGIPLKNWADSISVWLGERRWWWLLALACLVFVMIWMSRHQDPAVSVVAPLPQPVHPYLDTENLTEGETASDEPPPLSQHQQREAERAAAAELRQQQEAALRRFEERQRQDHATTEESPKRTDPRQLQHWRSLCDEWGATMDCQKGDRR